MIEILYLGSIISDVEFTKTVKGSKILPSSAPQSFEAAILKGLKRNPEVSLKLVSTESIAPYPRGNRFFLGNRIDNLDFGLSTYVASAINLPIIKQYGHSRSVCNYVKDWLYMTEGKERCVLMYSIYATVAIPLKKLCDKNDCKIFSIIPDVPSEMMNYTKQTYWLKSVLGKQFKKLTLEIQDKFDGYIYITEHMRDHVAPRKPYTVMEVLIDTNVVSDSIRFPKSKRKTIMYAGTLYKLYGIDVILKVFEKIRTDCDLVICGSGDCEDEIKEKAKHNSRIKFLGRLSREDVIYHEQIATLLLNIRNPQDTYTRFSFPSKMIEYMLSGTPMYTTKLPGIPDEYFDYVYCADNYSIESMASDLDRILSKSQEELDEFGKKASDFVRRSKNCFVQTKKILDFIKTQLL